jgi:DNA-directed RNA polymerase specialized sigma24 family protein
MMIVNSAKIAGQGSNSSRAAVDTSSIVEGAMTGCTARTDIFQHRLMEEPPPASATRRTRERYDQLVREAKAVCASCPLFTDCLFSAVAQHDVSGFVAGTTAAQRRSMRNLLDVEVQADDFDQLAGARGTRRPVSHEEVLRLRTQYPNDSLESLAMRLGCSLSTVKRHLRRARRGQSPAIKAPRARPEVSAVLDAFDAVVDRPRQSPRPGNTRVA